MEKAFIENKKEIFLDFKIIDTELKYKIIKRKNKKYLYQPFNKSNLKKNEINLLKRNNILVTKALFLSDKKIVIKTRSKKIQLLLNKLDINFFDKNILVNSI